VSIDSGVIGSNCCGAHHQPRSSSLYARKQNVPIVAYHFELHNYEKHPLRIRDSGPNAITAGSKFQSDVVEFLCIHETSTAGTSCFA